MKFLKEKKNIFNNVLKAEIQNCPFNFPLL